MIKIPCAKCGDTVVGKTLGKKYCDECLRQNYNKCARQYYYNNREKCLERNRKWKEKVKKNE